MLSSQHVPYFLGDYPWVIQAMNFIEAIEAMASDYRNLAADSNFFSYILEATFSRRCIFQYSVAYLTCSDKYQEIN